MLIENVHRRFKQMITLYVEKASAFFTFHMKAAITPTVSESEASSFPIRGRVFDEDPLTDKLFKATIHRREAYPFALLAKLVNNLLCGNVCTCAFLYTGNNCWQGWSSEP